MPVGSGHDDKVPKADSKGRGSRKQSDTHPKSPLLIMSPQETRLLSCSSETRSPWVETPFAIPEPDAVASSPTVPFSLQEYLNDEDGLERCIAGMPGHGQSSSSPECQAVRQMAQLNAHGLPRVAVANPATNTGFSDSEYIEVDYAELVSVRNHAAAATTDGLDGIERSEVISLDSTSVLSSVPSATSSSSSSFSSSSGQFPGHSLLDPSYDAPSNSLRHESLHRQLQEAGLSGLGDGTNSIQLYHRAATVKTKHGRVNKHQRARRLAGDG